MQSCLFYYPTMRLTVRCMFMMNAASKQRAFRADNVFFTAKYPEIRQKCQRFIVGHMLMTYVRFPKGCCLRVKQTITTCYLAFHL